MKVDKVKTKPEDESVAGQTSAAPTGDPVAEQSEAALENVSPIFDPTRFLKELMSQRERWENGLFKRGNDELYGILVGCLALYYAVTGEDDDSRKARKELRERIAVMLEERKIKCRDDSHLAIKITRCVFAADHKRVHVYSTALRSAIEAKVKPEELADYIRAAGGVEGIRRQKAKGSDGVIADSAVAGDTAAARDKVRKAADIAMIPAIDETFVGKSAKKGELNAALVEWKPDGSIAIKWIGHHPIAMRQVFRAYARDNALSEISGVDTGELVLDDNRDVSKFLKLPKAA